MQSCFLAVRNLALEHGQHPERCLHCGQELRRRRLAARPIASPPLGVVVSRGVCPDAQQVQAAPELRGHAAREMPKVDALLEALWRHGRARGVDSIKPRHQVAKRQQHVVLDALLRVAALARLAHLHRERRRLHCGRLDRAAATALTLTRQPRERRQRVGHCHPPPVAGVAQTALRRANEVLNGCGHVWGPVDLSTGELHRVNRVEVIVELVLTVLEDFERRAAGERDEDRDAESPAVGRG
eukprot:scaffold40909_cov73-Phaeocystis_antarctica.AAC.3